MSFWSTASTSTLSHPLSAYSSCTRRSYPSPLFMPHVSHMSADSISCLGAMNCITIIMIIMIRIIIIIMKNYITAAHATAITQKSEENPQGSVLSFYLFAAGFCFFLSLLLLCCYNKTLDYGSRERLMMAWEALQQMAEAGC